jgi:acyl-CoA synthetase (NDP forming)/GNAT superfamily N-acetyltransferase
MKRPGSLDVLTMRGEVVAVRPVGPDDRAELMSLYARASARSRYLRFFSAGTAYGPDVKRLLRCDGVDHVAVVAQHAGGIIGVASYERLDADEADLAILVDDAWQGHGIGTLLLEQLAATARRFGISTLVGDVLAENAAMLKVGAGLWPGVVRRRVDDPAVVRIRIPTEPDEAALMATGERDRTAEHHSLRPLFAPTGVAVVGAGRRPGGVGHEVFATLLASGFTARVHPVNPYADEVAGIPAYPSVSAIPDHVDLAVIAVPAGRVGAVVQDCAVAGVGAAVVLSSGFGETGPDGVSAQAELVAVARANGIRLVGPNCLGVINTDPAVRLNASFAPISPPPGHLAIASQSGAIGIAALTAASRSGVGVSSFVSLGNKADVSTNDLLAYWYDDAATHAVAIYVESFGNPRRFAWLAQTLSRRKPVLVVKSGRSPGGRRAGASHTAAAAAPDVAVDALFHQAGVIPTATLGELLDTARLLTDQPLPEGNRLAIIGNAGGLNVLAADAAHAANLTVPEVSRQVAQRLAVEAVPGAGPQNPLDLGADASPAALAHAVTTLAAAGAADALLITLVSTRSNDVPAALAALADAVDAHPSLPVVVVAVGAEFPTSVGQRKAPVYELPEDAVRALGHAWRYAHWRRQPLGTRPSLPNVNAHQSRRLVADVLASDPGWQPFEVIRRLLECYGIPLLPTRSVTGADAAVAAARELGFPVVVKAADPELVHKSDQGAVLVDLSDAHAVADAYAAIVRAVGEEQPPVLVQPMAASGVEMALGVVHDPLFGSLVMLGLGGIHTDLYQDRCFRLLPLSEQDATAMWHSLRAAPLLTGYRGAPAADVAALENLLLRIGRLAADLPEVAELDLNPVVVYPDGLVALDVKLRLAPVAGEPDRYVRSLD